MSTQAKLAGIPLMGPVSFELREGVAPSIGVFDVQPDHADALLIGSVRPVDLEFDIAGNSQLIANLYVLEEAPSPTPRYRRIMVADRRWAWEAGHILRRYNILRRVGVKRLENPQTVRESRDIVDRFGFAPYSLQEGGPKWTAKAVLEDIMRALQRLEKRAGLKVVGYDVNFAIGDRLQNFPIQNLEIDDRGPQALLRALALLPEAGVTVLPNGRVNLFSRADGAEAALVTSSGFEVMGRGHVSFISRARTRPKEVHVLFTREIEVRFDAEEHAAGVTFSRNEDDRFMENVISVPDYELLISGEKKVAQGTYVTLSSALAAWNKNDPPPGLGNLSIALIRRAMVPYLGLWAAIQLAGVQTPNANWVARVAEIQNSFRTLYRINRRWLDAMLSIRATRVATLDVVTGQRGASPVYSDFAILGSQRTAFSQAAGGNADLSYIMNVAGYPANGTIDAASPRAPARVRMVDPDQGIISIDWSVDASRAYEKVLPSQVTLQGLVVPAGTQVPIPGPSGDLSNPVRSIAFNSVGAGQLPAELTGEHKLATILTCIPASPNSAKQLHRIVVQPGEIAEMLPGAFGAGIDQALGPFVEIRIHPDIETARVAWTDDIAPEVEKAFTVSGRVRGPVAGEVGAETRGAPKLDKNTINLAPEGQAADQAASLNAIARAVTAALYATWSDRYQGTMATYLAANLAPLGRVRRILHSIELDGAATTTIEAPEAVRQEDMFSFLPAGPRRLIMRLANPGKSP